MSFVAQMPGDHDRSEAPLDVAFVLDRRQPVSDQVYEALKQAIVSVRLLPGASISENRIGRHFGVSRTPIRAAILRLVDDGLIEVFPQQGSFVAPIKRGDLADNQFVRLSLEVAVLREVAARWTPEMSATSRAIVERQAAAVAADDVEGFHEADERFHQIMTEFAGRQGVWQAILLAKTRLTRFIRLFGQRERLPDAIAEHTAVLDALDAGDAAAAEARLVFHLDRIFTLVEKLPEERRRFVVD